MTDSLRTLDAFNALLQQYPGEGPVVHDLSEEQRAWLALKMQVLAGGISLPTVFGRLWDISNRISRATEDIPCDELQQMASYIFEHRNEVLKLIQV